jgi:hypothetical protein
MKSTLVMKSRKSKKGGHMQGMRRSGDVHLWRDELTLLNRSNSLRLLASYSTFPVSDRSLFFANILVNVNASISKSLYSTKAKASRRSATLLQPCAARSLAYKSE